MPESVKVDWQVLTPPTVEPVLLSDLTSTSTGSYLRVDFDDDDAVITALISQCRLEAERVTGKALAPQMLQALFTMPQINGNNLTGAALLFDQDYYQYNESLGANPFSPAPFVLNMPQPPLQGVSLFEYRTTVFDAWQTWPQSVNGTNNYVADSMPMPGVVYLQYPPPAYQYRLTYTAGYTTIPPDSKLALMQLIAWKYENRNGEQMPPEILNALMGRKTWVL